MPGKHNAGGCGCCGSCWGVCQPLAFALVDPNSDDCCTDGSGSYALGDQCDADNDYYLGPIEGLHHQDFGFTPEFCHDCRYTVGGTGIGLDFEGRQRCAERFVAATCRYTIIALVDISISMVITNVAGVLTATLTVVRKYDTLAFEWSTSLGRCAMVGSSGPVEVTDTYQLETDCASLEGLPDIEIPFIERTRSDAGDITEIVSELDAGLTYSLCDPVQALLVLDV